MAREWALAGVPEDELQPPPPPKQPDTPKGKWENFWYHYKWVVLGTAAGLIVLTVLIVQMATRDEPDYILPLLSDEPLPQAQLDTLQAELLKFAEDVDGDGKKEIILDNWYLNPKENPSAGQLAYVNSQNLTVHLAAADRLFFIFQDTTYRDRIGQILEEGQYLCAPIEREVAGLTEGGTCWDWYGSALQQSEEMKGMPSHLYFGVRAVQGENPQFDREMKLLRAFVEGQKPGTPEK